MGKKYIIDLNPDCVEGEYLRIPARIAGEEQWLVTKAALTPYTEPDIELIKEKAHTNGYGEGYQDGYNEGMNDYLQSPEVKEESDRAYAHGYSDAESKFSEIRKETYDKGFEDGKELCPIPEVCHNNAYQKGLSDAWEAARKICTNWVLSDSVLSEIFGMDKTIDDVMKENTASEAIEKIRQYEQEKEEIKVGDEVELKCGVRPAIYMQGTKGSDEIYLLFNDGSCGLHSKSEIVRKTGRHFPEIATILENMRGETNE